MIQIFFLLILLTCSANTIPNQKTVHTQGWFHSNQEKSYFLNFLYQTPVVNVAVGAAVFVYSYYKGEQPSSKWSSAQWGKHFYKEFKGCDTNTYIHNVVNYYDGYCSINFCRLAGELTGEDAPYTNLKNFINPSIFHQDANTPLQSFYDSLPPDKQGAFVNGVYYVLRLHEEHKQRIYEQNLEQKKVQQAKEQQINNNNQILAQKPAKTIIGESKTQLDIKAVQQSTSIVEQCKHLDAMLGDLRHDTITTLNQYSPEELDALPKRHQAYIVSPESKKLLQERNLDSKALDVCNGNAVQQGIHKEFVTITNSISDLYYKADSIPTVREMAQYVVEFVDVGNTYNKQGNLIHALAAADCSWSFLNCAKALIKTDCDIVLGAGEGVIQATGNIAHIIFHPVQTAQAIKTAGYYLCKLVYLEIATADPELAAMLPEYYEKLCLDRKNQHEMIGKFVDQAIKNASLRGTVREVVSFGLESWTTGKLVGFAGTATSKSFEIFGRFFKATKNNFIEGAQKVAEVVSGKSEVVAVTPEGISIQSGIAENANNTFCSLMEKTGEKAKGVAQVERVANMSTFFKDFEFGKIIKNNSTKLNQCYKGQAIYRLEKNINDFMKKGYHYYLDSLHFDHIEVFDKQGSFRHVINLDGSLNLEKTEDALLQARKKLNL